MSYLTQAIWKAIEKMMDGEQHLNRRFSKPEGCSECKWPECGCQNSYTPPPQRSYADRADGATTFDPETQFEKDNGL